MKFRYLLTTLMLSLGIGAAQAADLQYGVLCYHDIVDESAPSEQYDAAGMNSEFRRQYYPQTITAQRLIAHFNWLKSNGYQPVSWQQIKDARAGRGKLPPKPVLLTFDDGYISFYKTIYPILKAYKYPAVYALVTSWMETPENGYVPYGKKQLSRKAFITWEQAREMQKSGLVEIASHTHDLHKSLVGNPSGSEFAAALSGKYENGRYETPAEYRTRVSTDLRKSADIIEKRIGKRPDVLVWPYGQFNQTVLEIARKEGFDSDLTLYDVKINPTTGSHIGRFLLTQETDFNTLRSYLDGKTFEPKLQRAVYINMDELYSPDKVQFNRNFDKLVSRVAQLGVGAVYLQAFADEDKNGIAEAAYFPNRHLKLKADLFSRVSWQLMTRSGVKVYAWMPISAFNFGNGYHYTDNSGIRRLQINSEKNRRAAAEVYEDLSFGSRFNGLAFHDDLVMADFNGNLPPQARNNTSFWQEAAGKTEASIRYTDQLKAATMKYAFNGSNELKTLRSLHTGAAAHENGRQWFNQSLAKFTGHYNYTSLTVMPYADNPQNISRKDAAKWVRSITQQIKETNVPLDKTVFELQAHNWHTNQPVRAGELADWIKALKNESVKNIAYRPDNFRANQPDINIVKPIFAIKSH